MYKRNKIITTMKKTIIIAAALAAMTACNKSLIEMTPAQEFGTISLGVTADTEMIVTKATELDATAAKDYIVTLSGSQKNWERTYSEITDDDKKMPAGSYTMSAKNISDEAAVAGNGAMQLVCPATSVEVQAGNNTPVELICSVANSKVTVNFDSAFTEVFTLATEPVVLDPSGRNIAMTPGAHETAEAAWFNDGTTVNWTLTATVKSTSAQKTYSGSFPAEKAEWNQLTFKAGANGTISLVIMVDDEITEVPVEETIDPLS
jgi:hypothetical protein